MALEYYDWLYYANMPKFWRHIVFMPTAAFWTGGSFPYTYYLEKYEEENGTIFLLNYEKNGNEANYLWEQIYGEAPDETDRLSTEYRRIMDHLRCKWLQIVHDNIPSIIPSRANNFTLGLTSEGIESTEVDLARCNDAVSDLSEFDLDWPLEGVAGAFEIEATYPGLKTYCEFYTPQLYRNTPDVNFNNVQVPRYIRAKQAWEDTGVRRRVLPGLIVEYDAIGDPDYGEWIPSTGQDIQALRDVGASRFLFYNFSYGSADIGDPYDAKWPFAADIAYTLRSTSGIQGESRIVTGAESFITSS